MMTFKLAFKTDLDGLVEFLSKPEIDNSFVKPLSQRGVDVKDRVYAKYQNGKWILVKDDKTIIGCCAVVNSDYQGRNRVEISTYVLDEKYRGKGLGGKLFDTALMYAKQMGEKSPIVFDSWEGSAIGHIALKRGFIKTKTFYGDSKRPAGVATVEYEYKGPRT